MEPDFNDSSASAWSKSSTGFALPFPFLSAFGCFCRRGCGVDGGSGPGWHTPALSAAGAAADGFFFFFLCYLTLRLVSIDKNRNEVKFEEGDTELVVDGMKKAIHDSGDLKYVTTELPSSWMLTTSLNLRLPRRLPHRCSRLVRRAGDPCQTGQLFCMNDPNTRENALGAALDGPLAIMIYSSSGSDSAFAGEPVARAETSSSSRCCLLLNRGGITLKSGLAGRGGGGQKGTKPALMSLTFGADCHCPPHRPRRPPTLHVYVLRPLVISCSPCSGFSPPCSPSPSPLSCRAITSLHANLIFNHASLVFK